MAAPTSPLLEMRGVTKRFGAALALSRVDFELHAGEVHALIGENGAGKSTLMKVLSGVHAPDAGTLTLDGTPIHLTGPRSALAHGIAMIYQELNLAPHLTVEQNLTLGREQQSLGLVDRGAMRQAATEALELLGAPHIRPDRRVAELDPAARQLVEIARALASNARIVVMDEPTSSLSRQQVANLIPIVRRMAERGVSVIYISHFLEEVREMADRFTVLRDGRTVAAGAIPDAPVKRLVEHMVGRAVEDLFPRVPHERGPLILRVDGLAGLPMPRRASLELHRGEILGLAGLVGAGRTELLRALFGLAPVRRGEVTLALAAGTTVDSGAAPHKRLAQGVGLLSEDRKDEALAQTMSVADNLTLSHTAPFTRLGWIDGRARDTAACCLIERLAIRCPGPAAPVAALSGGNQQKVALARLLHHDADVVLLDEPTRGIDVGSKVEIYRLIGELAAAQKAVLFVSSYLPELLGVCDRLAVMHRGVLGRARPTSEWTDVQIMAEASTGAA